MKKIAVFLIIGVILYLIEPAYSHALGAAALFLAIFSLPKISTAMYLLLEQDE